MKSLTIHSSRTRCLSILLFFVACSFGWVTEASAQGPLRFTYDMVNPPLGAYSNWVSLGLTSPFIEGDQGQFVQRQRVASTTYLGVDDLHLERFVGEDGLLTVGGRAIMANNDYRLNLFYDDPDVWFARAGFRRFSVFYDGSGGFLPQNGVFFSPSSNELAMDRGETFVETGLRMESLPHITLKYTRKIRDGKKPSLSWGDSNQGALGYKNIVPSFWKSDEVRNIVDANIEQDFGRNNVGVSIRYEGSDISNARNVKRRPDEPQQRFLTQEEGSLADLFHARAYTESRLHKKVLLNTSYSFTTLENDLSGSRIFGSSYEAIYDPVFAGRQQRDHGFLDLNGTSRVKHHVGSVNLLMQPWTYFTILPGARLEKQNVDAGISLIETDIDSKLAATQHPASFSSERGLLDLVGKLEARYTGIRRMLLYARGDWVTGEGDLFETEIDPTDGHVGYLRRSDDQRRTQKYLVGANWYPLQWLNFGVQAYRKHRGIDYEHPENPDGVARYPAFLTEQDFTTNAVNVRVRWRPLKGLSLANRYDFQRGEIRLGAAEKNEVVAGESDRHIFSNTITWAPMGRLYLQGSFIYVLNNLTTPSNSFTGAAENMVLESKNDYLNASITSGFALAQRVDLEAQYIYYRADNPVDNAEKTLAFDSNAEEHGLSAGVASQLTDQLRWTVRYIYFINRDDTFGGTSDYDLQMLYSSVQFQF